MKASCVLSCLVGLALVFGPGRPAAAQADLRLVTALKNQNAAAAKTLVRQRVGVNAADVDGSTPLQWAAHWNDVETVKSLLAAGAKPNVANRYGVTPLHEAATLGSGPVIAALLRAGAQADAAYGEGETALMLAARAGSLESVKLLIEANADVNAAEKFRGQTPLMLAAAENHAAVVKALLAAGARVNTRSVEYTFQALTGGAGGIIHDRPQGGVTALMLAARQGARAAAEALVAGGADINATEPQYGFTALQTAVFNGHYALARTLIEQGANANDGSLYIATEMRNLAKYTNRPNPPDSEDGVSHLDVIKLLLDKGADANAPYTKTIPPRQAQGNINVAPGSTALYRAVRSVDLATVTLLVDGGADPSKPIGDGSTPLMAAAGLGAPRGGDEEVTEAGDRSDPVDVIKVLIDKGANVNAANTAGMTAMHYAVQRGSDRIIEFLASKGARFDVKNKQGKTAAELARGRTAALVSKLAGQ
ncbi:MAG TPA: ankyrin repeat domain-containing protein [Vicinamibacterales bacterium]|nr:ankyrin repeat domain-containing protein [Vicinamibacterales bacterium]